MHNDLIYDIMGRNEPKDNYHKREGFTMELDGITDNYLHVEGSCDQANQHYVLCPAM